MQLSCAHCQKPFERYPSQLLRVGGGTYCSRACWNLKRKTEQPRCRCGKTIESNSRSGLCTECKTGWTPARIDLLRQIYPSLGPIGAGKVLGKTTGECRNKAHRLGIHADGNNRYSRGSAGKRDDLGFYVRSAWEANYARYLTWLQLRGEISTWNYEPQTFWFDKIRRGTRSYMPDFKVIANDGTYEWHEVKGWMDQKSKTRLKRMAKYYPLEKIVLIGQPWFRQAERSGLAGVVPNWEYMRTPRLVQRAGEWIPQRRTGGSRGHPRQVAS